MNETKTYKDKEDVVISRYYLNEEDQEKYDLGNGFGHIAIGVADPYATCEVLTFGYALPEMLLPLYTTK